MQEVKPKDIKPLLYAPLKSILNDATLTNTIQQTISPIISNYFNNLIKLDKKSNNSRYFDVVAKMSEQSNGKNPESDPILTRACIRELLQEEIARAASPELRLKYISELNKFDDNYTHSKQDNDITIILEQYKIPTEWVKSLMLKGLIKSTDVVAT